VNQENRPVIALSSCLAGENVRFDGAHKRDNWLLKELGQFVDYRTFCPEVAIGLGIPRPPIRLVEKQDVSGYVFKSKSPSCGVHRVKRYNVKGHPDGTAVGAFAEVICQQLPDLPIEEEGRLNDAVLRENFVNRVFVYQRWQQLLENGLDAASLIDFHSRHKYLVMAHSQAAYKRMGALLSHLKGVDMQKVAREYQHELMASTFYSTSRVT